jgi:hypothetical protein
MLKISFTPTADSAVDISETRTADSFLNTYGRKISLPRTADVRKTICENFLKNLVYDKKIILNLM